MLTVCYINRQSGRGYHYSDTNACSESAASKKSGWVGGVVLEGLCPCFKIQRSGEYVHVVKHIMGDYVYLAKLMEGLCPPIQK